MKTTFIYCLVDPRDGKIKYIGKSNIPTRRIKEHVYDSLNQKRRKCYKENWICKLSGLGLTPLLRILDEVKIEEYEYWEEIYIKKYKEIGEILVNFDDKGKGNVGAKSKELIDKIIKKLSKKVYQYSLNGDFINEFKSTRDAERILKINHGNIARVCNKVYKHSGGFVFSYEKLDFTDKIENQKAIKKPVVEIDKNGKKIAEFKSIYDASKQTNIDASNISRVCNGKLKYIKKRFFKFK